MIRVCAIVEPKFSVIFIALSLSGCHEFCGFPFSTENRNCKSNCFILKFHDTRNVNDKNRRIGASCAIIKVTKLVIKSGCEKAKK